MVTIRLLLGKWNTDCFHADMKANIANITPADLTISFKKQDHLFRDGMKLSHSS